MTEQQSHTWTEIHTCATDHTVSLGDITIYEEYEACVSSCY